MARPDKGTANKIDYNQLINQPITQLYGTEEKPITEKDLVNGLYLTSGGYHITEEYGDAIQGTQPRLIEAKTQMGEYEGEIWGNKSLILNNNNKQYTYIYNNVTDSWEFDGIEDIIVISYSDLAWVPFTVIHGSDTAPVTEASFSWRSMSFNSYRYFIVPEGDYWCFTEDYGTPPLQRSPVLLYVEDIIGNRAPYIDKRIITNLNTGLILEYERDGSSWICSNRSAVLRTGASVAPSIPTQFYYSTSHIETLTTAWTQYFFTGVSSVSLTIDIDNVMEDRCPVYIVIMTLSTISTFNIAIEGGTLVWENGIAPTWAPNKTYDIEIVGDRASFKVF